MLIKTSRKKTRLRAAVNNIQTQCLIQDRYHLYETGMILPKLQFFTTVMMLHKSKY